MGDYPTVKMPKGYWQPIPGLWRSLKVPHWVIEVNPIEFHQAVLQERVLPVCQIEALKRFWNRLTKGE